MTAQIKSLVDELETKMEHSEKTNYKVSKVAVGWHIQHSVLVASQIINALEKSNPAEYKYKFSFPKFLVFTLNKIPRGKAKAPDRVMPKEAFNTAVMKNDILILKNKLNVLDGLDSHKFFIHPMFGPLNLKATIKMLKLHTRHHIGIINDIIKH